jgi:predicted transcriptional regulator
MFSESDQNFLKRMSDAESILGSNYSKFKDLIFEYKIHYDSPLWDIVCFLIFTELPEKSETKIIWINFWHKYSKTRKFKNLVYLVPTTYVQLADMNKAKKFLLELLNQSKRSKKLLDWDVFLSLFFQFRASIKPTLSKREFSIFQTILEKQSMITKELSDFLNIDSSNISKYKNNLTSRYIIYQGIMLNHQKLNLSVFGLLFESPIATDNRLVEDLSNSIFSHSIYTGKIGCKSTLGYFVTPNFEEVKTDLIKMSERLKIENDVIFSQVFQFLTKTRLKSFNYSFYDYRKGKWILSSQMMHQYLYEYTSIDEDSIPIISREFEPRKKKKIALNRTGIEILNHILNQNHLSIRQIQSDLGLTEKEAKKQVNFLQSRDLYKLRYNPTYVFGLKNLVLFIRNPPSKQFELHKTLSFFPEVYSEQYLSEEKKGIYFIIRIPNELVIDAIEVLSEYFHEDIEKMFVVDQMYGRRYQLPIEKYETVFQEWKYDSEDILGRS